MSDLPDVIAASESSASECFADRPMAARDVARGVTRLFYRLDLLALCEVPLGNNRRADMMAVGPKGELVIVEIKVSRADLLGDRKWEDYLGCCDRFFWAVPSGFALDPFVGCDRGPDCAGLIIADRYDAEIVREAPVRPLAAPRRRAETLSFARRAARRLAGELDPALRA